MTRSASAAAKVNGSSAISANANEKVLTVASKKRKSSEDNDGQVTAKPCNKKRKPAGANNLEPIAEEDENVDDDEPAAEVVEDVPPQEAAGDPTQVVNDPPSDQPAVDPAEEKDEEDATTCGSDKVLSVDS